jgi:ABC-type bacteriocin/lantibiotic exporter with double-glycine peptidase domain
MLKTTNTLKTFFYTLIAILVIALIIFYATPFLAIALAFFAGIVSTLLVLYFWKKIKNSLEKEFKFAEKNSQKEIPKPDYIDVKTK